MNLLIACLREAESQFRAAETLGARAAMGGYIAEHLPQLLDRLERLEELKQVAYDVFHGNRDAYALEDILVALEKE